MSSDLGARLDLSIVVVNFNSGELLEECIESIEQHRTGLKLETIVIDNASSDASCSFLDGDRYSELILVKNSANVGFPRACNQGIRMARGDIILLLNPDARLQAGVLPVVLEGFAFYPSFGIITVAQTNGEHTIAPCYQFPSLLVVFQSVFLRRRHCPAKLTPVACSTTVEEHSWFKVQGYVSGAFLAITRPAMERIGLMDEHLFWAEDSDWCKRALGVGLEIGYCSDVVVFHHVSAIAKKYYDRALYFQYVSKRRYFKKHVGTWAEFLYKLMITISILPKWLFLLAIPPRFAGALQAKSRCRTYRAVFRELWRAEAAAWEAPFQAV